MLMKKKKKKSPAPKICALTLLPLLAVGAILIAKRRGREMLHSVKCCCDTAADKVEQMMN